MGFSEGNDDQSDNESLANERYERLFARYRELIGNNQPDNHSNDDTEYMTIKSQPVLLNDPEDDGYEEPPVKFPYLRRGAGLARFNMTPDQLKQGPPQFYKKREFKAPSKCAKKPQPHPVRKFATNAVKAFDDEIIPTLRNKAPASEAFEVPIPKNLLIRQTLEPKIPDLPKTPMKNLVLKHGSEHMPQHDRNEISMVDDESDSSDDDDCYTSRRLSYSEDSEDRSKKETEMVKRKVLTDNVKNLQNVEIIENVRVMQHEESQPEPEIRKFNSRQIADAMKRKGLTDNVKKHLGWNTPPKKRRQFSLVKKIKIKKPKPVREKLNLHELKDRLQQLEDVKNKLQAENNRIKRIEKDYIDEKLKLDKQRRELENMLKEERERIAEERLKLMEDVKKLKREKAVFDKYCTETRNLPTREEREEIRCLKEELELLKNSQKTKESRVGALQAQLRNRIAVLEKENTVLKEDLEIAKKISLKKVRFESEGKIRSKVIDAINTQLENKLKEPVKGKQMRRTKSANDFQPEMVKEQSSANVVELEEEISPKEVEELKDDGDSGVGSRPSSSGCSSGSLHESVEEIRKRLEKVLGDCQEKCVPTEEILEERPQHVYTVAYQDFQNFDKRKMLDITDDFSCFHHRMPKLTPTVCTRHGVPAQDKSRLNLSASSRFSDRDVIRTELSGGDIEEEELHTGVRRLWCGTCGACEVTYRNRLGYRRTTTPEGNTLEEHPDGMRECRYRSGEIVRKHTNGDKEVLFPNGDREFTTRGFKKLERPDGIVKTVFDDGRQETRYPSGRIRLKDQNGCLVMDTGGFMYRNK